MHALLGSGIQDSMGQRAPIIVTALRGGGEQLFDQRLAYRVRTDGVAFQPLPPDRPPGRDGDRRSCRLIGPKGDPRNENYTAAERLQLAGVEFGPCVSAYHAPPPAPAFRPCDATPGSTSRRRSVERRCVRRKKAPAMPGLLEHEPAGGYGGTSFALTYRLDSKRRQKVQANNFANCD